KLKLDSLEKVYDYTNIRDTTVTCSLVNTDTSFIYFKMNQTAHVIDNLELYPNPVGEQFTLVSNANRGGEVQLTITNMLSQVMFEKVLTVFGEPFRYQIDVSSYPAGTYTIYVKSSGR